MKHLFEFNLPYEKMMTLIKDETVEEFWIVFAFFSTEKVRKMLNALQKRRRKASVKFVVAASSINPLQEVVDDILNLELASWFQFHLVEGPLMHSKVFAARVDDRIKIYIGSANLTNSASSSNIESGVFLEFQDCQKKTDFIEELMDRCATVNSFARLKDLAILSHFRSEVLFLALEESKTRQAISIKSNRIKDLFSNDIDVFYEPKEEDVFNESSSSSFSFNLLRNEDRIAILNAESRLKDAIKANIAIKLDGYGWVSSSWSIRNLIDDSLVSNVYKEYLTKLISIRKKFSNIDYRTELFLEIESKILERASKHLIHANEVSELIAEIKKRFIADLRMV
jgi:HKD family nuclease